MSAFPMPSTVPFFGTLTQWAINTYYGVGQRAFNGGSVYVVTVGGESASSGTGPSGTGTGITDGGVTWNYVAAAYVAWAGSTAYTAGAIVSNGGNLYSCLVAGTSAASGGPTGTAGVITDGTAPTAVTWAYIGSAVAAQTTPTQKTADLGAVPGSPFFAQYFNWAWASVVGWILYLRDFLTGAHEWTKTQTFDEGIVVTNTDADTEAIIATGNGTKPALKATGGSNARFGVIGSGGATNGGGIAGEATGTGPGVLGLASGVSVGSSAGAGAGVAGYGNSSTGSPGVLGVSSSTGAGVYGFGSGSPSALNSFANNAGVVGNGDSGPGVFGQSKSTAGAIAIGGATFPGAVVFGGAGGGAGLVATGGSGNSDGVEAASSGTGAAFHATTGGVLVDSGAIVTSAGNVAATTGSVVGVHFLSNAYGGGTVFSIGSQPNTVTGSSGNDCDGVIVIGLTAATIAADGIVCAVTFARAYPNNPIGVMYFPLDGFTAGAWNTIQPYSDSSNLLTTNFNLRFHGSVSTTATYRIGYSVKAQN